MNNKVVIVHVQKVANKEQEGRGGVALSTGMPERTGINRVTFYLHYLDITDMMEKIADDMIGDISNLLDQATIIQ